MNAKNAILETPYGTRDLLPADVIEMRYLDQILSQIFSSWGYDEIATPTIEHLETLVSRIQEENDLFILSGNKNRLLALRNEMTTPIARLVSSRLKDLPAPLKLSYIGNVFRIEQTQEGRQCEFHQAGVELMGCNTAAADAEIIALAIEAVLACGIKEFQIHIGQVNFLKGMMTAFGIDDAYREALKNAMESHDIVQTNQLIDTLAISSASKELLKSIPLLNGKEDVIEHIYKLPLNQESQHATNNLVEIYSILKDYHLADYVHFDFGVIRDFHYYTGMVFEGYSPGLGFPLCGGGRYDDLLGKYGAPMPATGFALGMERVILARKRQNVNAQMAQKDVYIGYGEGQIQSAITRAKALRNEGNVVELAVVPQTKNEAASSGKQKGYVAFEYFA